MSRIKLGVLPCTSDGFAVDAEFQRKYLRMIDTAGVESLWLAEHPLIAEVYEKPYPYTPNGKMPFPKDTDNFFDPLEFAAFASGVTDKIKLATGVLLVPLHPPIVLAKRIATLDALSGGRMLLGVGTGWQKEEFLAIGVPYEERGKRLDEGIAALRALWTTSPTTFHGKFYNFDQVYSHPKPANSNIPIIIGGSTDLAARRAGRIGNGFHPHYVPPEELGRLIEVMRATAKEAGRDSSKFDVTFFPGGTKFGCSLDLGIMKAYADAGATRLLITPSGETQSTDLKVLERFIKRCQDEVIAKL